MSTSDTTDATPPSIWNHFAETSAAWSGPPTAKGMFRAACKFIGQRPVAFLILILVSSGVHLATGWLSENFSLISEDSVLSSFSQLLEPIEWLTTLFISGLTVVTVLVAYPAYFAKAGVPSALVAQYLPVRIVHGLIATLLFNLSMSLLFLPVLLFPEPIVATVSAVVMPLYLYIMLKLTLVTYIAMFEQVSMLEAFRQSWLRTKEHTWAIFMFWIVLIVPIVVSFLVAFVISPGYFKDPASLAFLDFIMLASGIAETFATLGPLWLYFEQRYGRITNLSVPFHAPTDAEPAA